MTINASEFDSETTPDAETPAQLPGATRRRVGWTAAMITMWIVGAMVAFTLVVSAGVAIMGPSASRSTTVVTAQATATAAISGAPVGQLPADSDLPPIDYSRMHPWGVPMATDITRACNANTGAPAPTDPVARARCAQTVLPSDMYELRALITAGLTGDVATAKESFTTGTNWNYVYSVVRDPSLFADAKVIFWGGSHYTNQQTANGQANLQNFYGTILYGDGTMRPFAAIFQDQNGAWKLRTIQFGSRA